MYYDVNNLYRDLIVYGTTESPRGNYTREILGTQIEFRPDQWFIEHKKMPLNEDYIRAELDWYLRSDQYDLSICEHASIWKDCVDFAGKINSNYGYHFVEQCGHVVKTLREDPFSRRAVVNINQRVHNYIDCPDVPCTMYMNFMIRDGEVIMFARMRSQDAVFGLRNDLPAFQMFKLYVCNMLELPPGPLYISADSFHVYERHIKMVSDVVLDEKDITVNPLGFDDMSMLIAWTKQ